MEKQTVSTEAQGVEVKKGQEVVDSTVITGEVSSQISPVEEGMALQDFKSHNDIIREQISQGAKMFKDNRVTSVTLSEEDNYVRVTLMLSKPVPGFVRDDNDVLQKGFSNMIFVSNFSLIGALKEDEDLAFIANKIIENPSILEVLLVGAKIDILQIEVEAGVPYVNPFSKNANAKEYVGDTFRYMNNVVGFKLSNQGKKAVDRIMDRMLGF